VDKAVYTGIGQEIRVANKFEIGLEKSPANYQPLTPLTYMERAAKVFPDRVAVIHGKRQRTYRDFWQRSRQLASALAQNAWGRATRCP